MKNLSFNNRIFQSTLSMRRATNAAWGNRAYLDISIHALHEESDAIFPTSIPMRRISIHALHEESDLLGSMWGNLNLPISIHALHEESDSAHFTVVGANIISIHALHEESDVIVTAVPGAMPISIHALHEESDASHGKPTVESLISIHALHEESDAYNSHPLSSSAYFNPRSP